MNRRDAFLCILSASSSVAWAQMSTSAPIRIVVPYTAGGITDNMARTLADVMQKSMGTVIVENKPGAAGLIATRYVQNAPPDGRTLLFVNDGFITVPMLSKKAAYDPLKDFAPVAIVGRSPAFLMVNAGMPATTVRELIAYAKTQPSGIDAGNSGPNSAGHLMAAWFAKYADVKINHIPYKGSAETAMALVSGQVHMQLTSTTEALNAQVKAGKVRAIAVMAKRRDPVLAPGLPTIQETLPEVAIEGGWFGLLVPNGTPQVTIAALNASMKGVSEDAAIRARFASASIEMVHTSSEQMASELRASAQTWQSILKELQVTAEQ